MLKVKQIEDGIYLDSQMTSKMEIQKMVEEDTEYARRARGVPEELCMGFKIATLALEGILIFPTCYLCYYYRPVATPRPREIEYEEAPRDEGESEVPPPWKTSKWLANMCMFLHTIKILVGMFAAYAHSYYTGPAFGMNIFSSVSSVAQYWRHSVPMNSLKWWILPCCMFVGATANITLLTVDIVTKYCKSTSTSPSTYTAI